MIPHIHVHCRCHNDRRRGREVKRAQEIVADPAAEFCKSVRRRRSNQQQIGALRDGNMFDRTFKIRLATRFGEQASDYFFPGERGKGKRLDELACRARHDDLDRETFLLQTAHQFGRFVGRHSAGDAESDAHRVLAVPYLRRLTPSLSSSTDLPGLNSYSIKPLLTSSHATRVGFNVRGFSNIGGAPAIIWRARRAASTTYANWLSGAFVCTVISVFPSK